MKLEEKVAFTIVFIACIGFIIVLGYVAFKQETEPKIEIKKCTNIKKFYKDDILFDNFYVACDEPINLEIGAELYTRIVEGQNYTIEYRNGIFNKILKD